MSSHLILNSSVVKAQQKSDIPFFRVGSIIEVHYKIIEGDKERIQVFAGVVIDRHKNTDMDATFTVRKLASGKIEVDRTFPLHSPLVDKIVVKTLQRTRRSSIRQLSINSKKVKITSLEKFLNNRSSTKKITPKAS
jgi:large subunit ribosomal protein L19